MNLFAIFAVPFLAVSAAVNYYQIRDAVRERREAQREVREWQDERGHFLLWEAELDENEGSDL